MHSSSCVEDSSCHRPSSAEVLVAIAALVTEGRTPAGAPSKCGFSEGPHCPPPQTKPPRGHHCNLDNALCIKYEKIRSYVLSLWQKSLPLCIDVLLVPKCCCDTDLVCNPSTSLEPIESALLLEQWHVNILHRRTHDNSTTKMNVTQLLNALRSQLYFSQISAWFSTQSTDFQDKCIVYCLTVPGETYGCANFTSSAQNHTFPNADLSGGVVLRVSLSSLPRSEKIPLLKCSKCDIPRSENLSVLDDRMQTSCTLKGKHRCEDFDDFQSKNSPSTSKSNLEISRQEFVEVLSVLRQTNKKNDLVKQSKGDLLLEAIIRSSKDPENDLTCKRRMRKIQLSGECDNSCDNSDNICDNFKRKKTDYIKPCDSKVFNLEYLEKRQKVKVKQKITFEDDRCNKNNQESVKEYGIPSAFEQAKFRKSLDSAASMVFHSRTGLPLTSSPAPVRRGKSCFDFDSSINSVSAIRSALFSLASCSTDEDSESDCSIVSPCSPDATNGLKQRESPTVSYKHRGQSSGLLGSFVESVLNGRLEPVSTVHGFSAELGASGSFCPRHVVLPVTVFFYTLGDNDKVSTPYLGHINLGKKGYNVPKIGTIQVTLFNPLGTVVKMFVIMYDLSDMPPNSQTFIRQRMLFMPANCEEKNLEFSQKWLRYLIHLRFMSSKSGRIYLHSDIRMIICRKSDLDTATAHGIDMSYELRSFINSPTNPRFSPRK